ncbi:MAG: diphthine--ammonia ligase [Candidatus Lokiarchaeota archaeon]
MKEKVLFTWSGGKDGALAYYELQKARKYEVIALLTNLVKDNNRTMMHGVQQILLEQQASALGIPIELIFLKNKESNKGYELKMREILTKYKTNGVTTVVFGDIFLEDLRSYREINLSKIGMKALFPLWKKETKQLSNKVINLGFKAIITCVDSEVLDKKFVGREYDLDFLSNLPPNVDPCGENGEFHSFVYDGPIFQEKIAFKKGDIFSHGNRFYFCDLIPIQ